MRWVRPLWTLLPCLILLFPVCRGQKYLFVRYTPKDGLANSRARFMYQDSKGRLYVSTFGGLSVYDGARFTNYTTENGLSTSLVNDVVEVGDDSSYVRGGMPSFASSVNLKNNIIQIFAGWRF